MRYPKTIYCLLFLLLSGTFAARGYYYKQYTTSNLLISNKVYHSLCDRKGYMWFFTDKGVSKFDGSTFKNFTVFDGLGDIEVFYAYEDRSGRLWLYTYNGTPCFIRNDTVYNQKNDALLKKLPVMHFITSMYEDSDSSLYIGYHGGEVIRVYKGSYKMLIGRDEGDISTFAKHRDTIRAYKRDSILYFKNGALVSVKKTKRNKNYHDFHYLVAAGAEGVKIYYRDSLVWQRKDVNLNLKNIIHLYFDEQEHLFCATLNGLTIINIKNNTTEKLFENEKVSCTGKDIYGNYWITTSGNGIYYLDKNLDKIKPLNLQSNTKTYTTNYGQLFFTSNNYVYYPEGNGLAEIKVPGNADEFEPFLLTGDHFFYSDGTSTLCLDRKTGKTTFISVKSKNVYSVGDDKFLLVGWHQLDILTLHSKKMERIPHQGLISKSGYDSADQKMYFIERNKLYSCDINSLETKRIDTITYHSIEDIVCLKDKIVLLTNGKNIISYNKTDHKRTVFDKLAFICYEIYNGNNKLILNTSHGYFTAHDLTGAPRDYTHIDHPVTKLDVLSLHAAGNNIICNLNGKFYIFNDSLLNEKRYAPQLFVDKITVNGKTYRDTNLKVGYLKNTHVTISLSTLRFNNLTGNFRYRIIHNDTSQWYNSASGKLDLLLEQYGDYAIELCAVTENNVASPARTLLLNILPPFYYSYTFYFIVAIILSILIFFALRIYHDYRARHFQNELNYLQLENRAINSLLNPHFIFNAINNIQNLVNIDSRDKANNYLAILSKLIRQNIDNLQYNFISFQKELNLIKNYIFLQNLRFDNKIKLEIDDATESLDNIQVPPLLIHTFVENAVVHGFKKDMNDFTIKIDTHLSVDSYLIIKITDNGAGFKAREQNDPLAPDDKTSIGIDFTRKRLERLSAFYKVEHSLEIDSVNENGRNYTEVVIIIYSKFKELSDSNWQTHQA